MISSLEAERLISQTFTALAGPRAKEEVPIEKSIGRILAHDIIADRDQPPFDRVAMDGIAVVLPESDTNQPARSSFRVGGRLAPGQSGPDGSFRLEPGQAIEVMTGAALPSPWNAIVPWEDLQSGSEGSDWSIRPTLRPSRGMNIHPRASDYRQGDRLVSAGTRLSAPHIHVLASVGCSRVPVRCQARVSLLATGDELVPIDASPGPQQIRTSNMVALAACLGRAGLEVVSSTHSPDRKDALARTLAAALAASDVTFVSGAVSKGSKDFVPAILSSLGCVRIFHGVAHKPGKPMWFGTSPHGGVVFALPGNPVSSLVCFLRYALPQLRTWGESHANPQQSGSVCLPLIGEAATQPDYTLLLPAQIALRSDGTAGLRVRKNTSSGNYAGLLPSDGIAEIPLGGGPLREGTPVRLFPWP